MRFRARHETKRRLPIAMLETAPSDARMLAAWLLTRTIDEVDAAWVPVTLHVIAPLEIRVEHGDIAAVAEMMRAVRDMVRAERRGRSLPDSTIAEAVRRMLAWRLQDEGQSCRVSEIATSEQAIRCLGGIIAAKRFPAAFTNCRKVLRRVQAEA